MGLKIAVVGGGSTYTPELVEGFEARRDRMPIDELVLLDIDAERLAIVGGLAQRMLDRLDWTGRLTCTGDRDAAIDGADFVLIQLRVGGQAARLVDETLPPTFGVIGQETTGAGGFAKALRTVPLVLELAELTARRRAPGRLDRRLHEPGRDRQPGPHRRRASRHRPVQRGDQHPARHGRAVRRRARPGPARARRAQPPELGARRPCRRRRPATGAHRGRRGSPRRARRPARRAHPEPRRDPVVLPALLLPDPPGRRGAARRARHAPRRSSTSSASCSRCTRTRAWPRSRRSSRTAAAPSTARRPPSSSRRSTTAPATSRSSTSATTGPSPTCPTTRSSRSRPGSTATARIPCPSRRWRPRCAGSSRPSKAYEHWRSRPRSAAIATVALRALLANPLVADYDVAAPLLEALLEANRAYLPRFFR